MKALQFGMLLCLLPALSVSTQGDFHFPVKGYEINSTPSPTLYWNPAVQTDANGEAVVRFQNRGEFKDILVTAETVTPDGQTGKLSRFY